MSTIFGIPADILLYVLLGMLGMILIIVIVTALRFPLAFRLGIRNLPRRKAQTGLIVLGLALSTLIITSALGIGDTVDFSVKSGVYDDLGSIDEIVSKKSLSASASFGFGSGPELDNDNEEWFDAAVAEETATLVDDVTIDSVVGIASQTLPVFNADSELSEASVEVRGIDSIAGSGFTSIDGLAELEGSEVLANSSLAESLDAQVGDELWIIKGQPTPVTLIGIVPDGELAGSDPSLLWSLPQAQAFFNQPESITAVFVSNVGDRETGVDLTQEAISDLSPVAGDLVINPIKADSLEAAATSAEFITTLFVTFGTFSIFSGILLIFLIFSVLASERKSELGMGRAVGLQRADLVRQFVSEGIAYDFMAALVGATLGVVAALLLAQGIANLIGDGSLDITPRVSPRSALIGYSLGLFITFITVTISAIRISKINIIAAIRDLNLPNLPREGQWTLFLRPFTVWRVALKEAGEGQRREALRNFLVAGPKAVINFWSGLFARGPVLLVMGFLFAWVGVNVAKQSGVYGLGVSMFLIGFGQLLAWLLVSDRVAYSLTGIALILYWSLPLRSVGALAELDSNPGDFFISGLFLVGGAITLFLYNAEALLNLFAGLLGRFGRLLAVARVSIAYPVIAKGRTATTLAMFSLIIFTLVSTTTVTNTFSNFLDAETGSGGYDVMVQTNPFNPLGAGEFEAAVEELVNEGEIIQPTVIAASISAPVQAAAPGMESAAGYFINGVDDQFFETHRLELSGIASGYEDEVKVWAAVQSDPTLIVIDNFSIDRGGDPTFQPDDDSFLVSTIAASENRFDAVEIEVLDANGDPHSFTIVGVLGSAPNFYGALMNAEGAASLGYTQANRFFLRLPPDADARQTANAIEASLSRQGVQTILLKEVLEESRSSIRSIFYLIQGFIGLGLFIGIAALGVVTIRAVVERRQQIGILRAIGFQREKVQGIFLFEGLFIAGLGTLIGYGLALTFAYNLYLQVASDQGLDFLPPWLTLALIGLGILLASLLTTWLPARSTSKVIIAEALRYE
ncbi:MAG: FtsX-like permease family protein [Anaerolineales bacterium]|nr:FtsX-like permease family protein [Anaerolineales bacterium]